jgi:hypothetical protein
VKQFPANGRIGQQVFQRLFIGEGIEEVLVVERGGIELFTFFSRERIGGKSAQQLFQFVLSHELFPTAAHKRHKLLPAPQIPGVDGIDGRLSHQRLNLGKALSFQFPSEQLPTPHAELCQGGHQPLHALPLIELRLGRGVRRGKGEIVDRFLIILAAAKRLAVGIEHLEPKNLKGEWNQFSQIGDMGVFFVKQGQDFLRHVLRLFPRYP